MHNIMKPLSGLPLEMNMTHTLAICWTIKYFSKFASRLHHDIVSGQYEMLIVIYIYAHILVIPFGLLIPMPYVLCIFSE